MSFRTGLASFLLVSITFLIVPPEFVHHYFHHTDTVDHFFGEEGHFLEPKHLHCLILKVEIPEYVVDQEIRTQTHVSYSEKLAECYVNPLLFVTHRHIKLRGPPHAA